jgi:hypothetical protein
MLQKVNITPSAAPPTSFTVRVKRLFGQWENSLLARKEKPPAFAAPTTDKV